jgi:hypothetical protein
VTLVLFSRAGRKSRVARGLKRALALFALLLAWSALPCVLLQSAHAQTLDQMRFSAQVLSPVLPLAQTLETRLRITNCSQTSMYVFKHLDFFITARAYDGAGASMDKQFIEEVGPPPLQGSDFILLKPGQYIEHIRHDDLAQLGIRKPGQYRIDFNYSTGISPAFTDGLPVWLGTQQASIVIRVSAN